MNVGFRLLGCAHVVVGLCACYEGGAGVEAATSGPATADDTTQAEGVHSDDGVSGDEDATSSEATGDDELGERSGSDVSTAGEEDTSAGSTFVFDEQFDGNYSLSHANNGEHPTMWVEHGGLKSVAIADGLMTLTGNSTSTSYGGYHRMFSRDRFGGPGVPIMIRARLRCTGTYASDKSTPALVNLGLKFPHDDTPYAEDDPRSVIGDPDGATSPASFIFRIGVGEDGYTSIARNAWPEHDASYYTPWAPVERFGYELGEWKEVSIRAQWLATDEWSVKYWFNAEASGEPVYEWTGYAPYNEPGFLWLRTDFSDFQYDWITIEEL